MALPKEKNKTVMTASSSQHCPKSFALASSFIYGLINNDTTISDNVALNETVVSE
jgi:hypothetical protein